jgi:hypothetical protein
MNISISISTLADINTLLPALLKSVFNLDNGLAAHFYNNDIKKHFDQFKNSTYFLIEHPYVDRVHRDSYYHYFSTKKKNYNRDSIRISIFEGAITSTDFRSEDRINYLKKIYRGFIILRPTEPFFIGRSLISPEVLNQKNFEICTTTVSSSVNSIKLTVEGFPHSSQDSETISCAETTLWELMEYFSTRYSEYQSILPSKIIKTLNQVSSERQVPSKGLNIQQISFALREFGFGTKIYSRAQYGYAFENLLSCYIESGIPLIIAMENNNIGHALLCIGHEFPTNDQIDALVPTRFIEGPLANYYGNKNIVVYDYDDLNEKYVFIDDNHPVYQLAYLNSPANHYPALWQNCKITFFIAPLYPKVYLEAYEAKNFIYSFLVKSPIPLADNSNILIKFYLTSTRSFKSKLAVNSSFDDDIKNLILETVMPKFIWVAELSNKTLIKNKQADGLVILDATEANINYGKPLIVAIYQGNYITFAPDCLKLENFKLPLGKFDIYKNNLKSFV